MPTKISAALIYAPVTFAIGFVLGAAREVALNPAFGTTLALVVELPIMIAACFLVAHWCLSRLERPLDAGARLVMGGVALVLLLLLEDALARALRGMSLLAQWSQLTGSEWALTVIGLGAFLLAPLIVGAPGTDQGAEFPEPARTADAE